jgi:CDP-paratose 2-epimerase
LCDLVTQQVHHMESWSGETLCVGGGNDNSASLVELTSLCQEATGNHVAISRLSDTSSLDTRIIISDSSAVRQRFSWAPTRNLTSLIGDLRDWGTAHKSVLQQLFVG